VAEVVRVVPDPQKNIAPMSLFHYGNYITVMSCETPEDAVHSLVA
jgi:hypothetical protein